MTPDAESPDERRRRQLRRFATWISVLAAEDDALAAAVGLCRRIDANGLTKAEMLASLDALDDLLADAMAIEPKDES